MQRKPGFPVANCSIKMPDCAVMPDPLQCDDDSEQQQRRQQLINFGHSQWGFNNWSWSVSKQELDFVDFTNGKYCAGVVAFVSITVKSFDIHRENIGYATSIANTKGFAIYKSRKCAVTNALRETLLSFGGSVATELSELLEASRDAPANMAELGENNQNVANKLAEPKNLRKEPADVLRSPLPPAAPQPPAVKNARAPPANLAASAPRPPPPAPRPPPPAPRPPAGPAPPARSNQTAYKYDHTENEQMIVEQEPPMIALDGLSEEEARAERKRRQRQAQEEFRLKQLMKHQGPDDNLQLGRDSSGFDNLLMGIPTQDIMIEATGDEPVKRKSPGPDTSAGAAKRRNSCRSKLDIVEAD